MTVCSWSTTFFNHKYDDMRFCYQLIITITKFVIIILSVFKSNHKIFQEIFATHENRKSSYSRTCVGWCVLTVH